MEGSGRQRGKRYGTGSGRRNQSSEMRVWEKTDGQDGWRMCPKVGGE